MSPWLDLNQLLKWESSTVEWKKIGDPLEIVRKLTAFANGETAGVVICGIEEARDEHGFVRPLRTGLTAGELRRLKKQIPAICLQNVAPPLIPDVQEVLLEENPTRRVLVFQVSPSRHAHAFREPKGAERYWINADSHTVTAKGELLHELLRRKGALPPFLEQACIAATLTDIDLPSFEAFVQSLGLPRSASDYLEPGAVIDSITRPLVVPVPASGSSQPRPTYLALLLFARDPVRFLPGAHVALTVYSGASRTASHAQRFDLTGPIPPHSWGR